MVARGFDGRVCVVGAGSSGLAAVRELVQRDVAVECFEQGSRVGGNWCYENDGASSAAYASLRTNVSRERMQYPSFPMPAGYGDFPRHWQMAAYLEDYADVFALREHIWFRTRVEAVVPHVGGWRVRLGDGQERDYGAVIVANGHDWEPNWPELRGRGSMGITHARDYRTPEPFTGRRVLSWAPASRLARLPARSRT